MKKRIESGTVISIKLNNNLGYSYAKVVNLNDFSKIDLSKTLYYIIYPYNYTEDDYNNFDITKFNESEPLTGPLFVIDILFAIRNGIYNIVAMSQLKPYEKEVPAFRGFSSKVFEVHKYEKDAYQWMYFEGGRPLKWIVVDYHKVKHLEGNKSLSHKNIETRLSMEILNRKGVNVKNYYDMEEWQNLTLYYNMLYTTPFNKVPDNIKGKAILW